MTNAQHTPGPWTVKPTPEGKAHISNSNRGAVGYERWMTVESDAGNAPVIARLPLYGNDVAHWDENEANARLIAAAPELLEALEYMANTGTRQDEDAMKMAKAAIAKAKGE